MSVMQFVKKWTLPCGMALGVAVYLLFTEIPLLIPVGKATAPFFISILPYLIFTMLYITFCKIQTSELRPRTWHFWLQGIRTLLSASIIGVIWLVDDMHTKIILEGIFVCVICPTAAAAPVITEKLGGSIASLTVYTLIANCVTSIIIPTFFPLVETGADITFSMAFMKLFGNVTIVLITPLCLALLTRRFLPKVAEKIKAQKNIAFYIWAFNLSVVMGMTMHNILTAEVDALSLTLLIISPLFVTLLLFSIGKAVGRCYGESISAGQALGQKNTIVGIWLTITFLNPTAAIAPCAYVIWQNIVNAWQLWYKDKYGKLKW